MWEPFESVGLPAKCRIRHAVTRGLWIELSGKNTDAILTATRCRWALLSDRQLITFDYQVNQDIDVESYFPQPVIQNNQLYNDRFILNYFERSLVFFTDQEHHEVVFPGAPRNSDQWKSAPEIERSNLSLFVGPTGRPVFELSFKEFLNPLGYSWHQELQERTEGRKE